MAMDAASSTVYFTGYTSSPDYPITNGAPQTTYGGGETDGFLTQDRRYLTTVFGRQATGQIESSTLRPIHSSHKKRAATSRAPIRSITSISPASSSARQISPSQRSDFIASSLIHSISTPMSTI